MVAKKDQTAADTTAETTPKAKTPRTAKAKTTAPKDDASAATTTTATETRTTTAAPIADLFNDVAAEIEKLTKGKALQKAVELHKVTDDQNFKLGGILAKILENKWFDDHETFGEYVEETFGFKERKARYLIEIYVELVNQRIPYSKVAVLGWTKIKLLAKVLSVENVDEWVEKASQLSVRELESVLKQDSSGGDEEKNTATKNNVQSMNFKLHPDQVDAVTTALAKAKADKDTEHDNVALEHICNSFLSGAGGEIDFVALFKTMDPLELVTMVDQAHPEINFSVDLGDDGNEEVDVP